MKRWGLIISLVLILSLIPAWAVKPAFSSSPSVQSFKIYASEDTWIDEGGYVDSKNYRLRVGTYNGKEERPYLKFNLSSIPRDAVIVRATLHLHAYYHHGSLSHNITVYGVLNDSWSENELTWNNQPLDVTGPLAWSILDLPNGTVDYSVSWDVTEFVKAQLEDDGVASFYLHSNLSDVNTKDYIYFNSRESSYDNHPYLEIEYYALSTVSIQEIQSNTVDGDASTYDGQKVATEGVVTAVAPKGFFIQNGTGPWSGIYVYLGSTPDVNQGDYVRVIGTVDEYYGMTELKVAPENVTVLGTSDVPEPVVLQTGDVAQEQWESVLVKVENVVVTNPNLGYGEWEIDDGSGPVRVDDLMYRYTPQADQALDYVVGVVYYSYGNFKIEPRGEGDIGVPPEIPVVSIQEIQSNTTNGDSSAYKDQIVTTRGVVTFVDGNGFAIQNGTGPWSGIWVYTGSVPDVEVGDLVEVRAMVNEYYGFTELNYKNTDEDLRYIQVLGTSDVPGPVVLSTGEVGQEQWEGVLVEVRNVTVVDPDLGYGEWLVDDGSGPIRIDDRFYDYSPDRMMYRYIRGIVWYSYGNYKIEPRYADDIKPYVPSLFVSSVEWPYALFTDVPAKIVVKVVNNGTEADNATVILYAGGVKVGSKSSPIGAKESATYEFIYMPTKSGELLLGVSVIDGTGHTTDIVRKLYLVIPNPYQLSYGLTPYYERLYNKERDTLTPLYENFTWLVKELQGCGVDLGDLEPRIQWINETMGEVQREYSIYNTLKGLLIQQNPYRSAYYYPVMMHIRKAAMMNRDIMRELEFVLPILQSTYEQVEPICHPPAPANETMPGNETGGAPTNQTNVTPSPNVTIQVTKVLIDATHGQYYVKKVGVSYLMNEIETELGWEVELNQLPLTYDHLKDYDVLILLNPKDDLTEAEISAIQQFVENGGGLFIAGEWYKYLNIESLNALVEKYGIEFNADELMDDDHNSGKPWYPFVGIYNKNHPVMKFVPDDWTMYYNGDTLKISGNAVWLIKGYDTSYSVDADGNVVYAKGTNPIIAAAVDLGTGRIVAYGSSKALSDSYYQKYIKSTWPFIKGALLWLAHQE
ncbi:DNRLRE domain-containing protein [Thermococcus sp. MAR1]|uniref:DNRLRE domain-containing protein n=1 Tax=Thermococcus sp. MAR1 TaxID=1638263 RepID=UPI00143CA83F|nr:DNRLRE domain-containing protein [Thermococcus sp. MAR1]